MVNTLLVVTSVALAIMYIVSIFRKSDRWYRAFVPLLILWGMLIHAVMDIGLMNDMTFLHAEVNDVKFGFCTVEDATRANYEGPNEKPRWMSK